MRIAQPERIHQSAADIISSCRYTERSNSFASTLEGVQSNLAEDEQLSADQARLVIRMLGAAMLGQFQQVSGLSGEDADTFFSNFDMLRSFSSVDQPLPTSALSARARQMTRAYQDMANTLEEIPGPATLPTAEPSPASEQSAAPTSVASIHDLIDDVARSLDLSPALVHSVVFAESSYRADAVSPAGAEGLMQLMPATAQEVGVKDTFDPQDNLTGGCRYLKGLLDKYDGDLDHALAAYNWGQGNVDRKGLEQMPTETRNYIAKVRQGINSQA